MKAIKGFVLFGLIVWAASSAQAQLFQMKNPLLGEAVPEFKASALSGGASTFSEYRGGQKAIIFFWATWCPHCRVALKELNANKDEIARKGIKLVAVDVGEPARQVQAYVHKNKLGVDVFLDEDESISEEFGIIGVPTFYFVNEDGIVQDVQHHLPEDYEAILSRK